MTRSGTSGRRGSTRVSGPGQNRAARAATRGSSAGETRFRSAASARCTIRGSNDGRAFTSKTRATALGLKASAPRPYTVSVGKATSPPRRRTAAASSIAPGSCGRQDARAHDGGAAGRLVGRAPAGARGEHPAGRVDVRPAGVAPHEADPVVGQGGEEAAALLVGRPREASRRVVDVDHGEPHRHAPEEPRQLACLVEPGVVAGDEDPGEAHRPPARGGVAAHGGGELGDGVARGDGNEPLALLGEGRGQRQDQAVGVALRGVALDLRQETHRRDRDAVGADPRARGVAEDRARRG